MTPWNSEEVRTATLCNETFKLNMVLIMEDSEELSVYAEFLAHRVHEGIRPKFTCITAAEIAKKVHSFVEVSHSMGLPGNDTSDSDVAAEAIKHLLLQIRSEMEGTSKTLDKTATLGDITGERSKNLLKNSNVKLKDNTSKSGRTGDESDSQTEPRKTAKRDKVGDDESDGLDKGKRKGKSKGSKVSKTKESPSIIRTTSVTVPRSKSQLAVRSRTTTLRKRGEPKVPLWMKDDDLPRDGPQLYVLLQGFYNPDLLDALDKIGVKVDGIVLITKNKLSKRNFTVIEIEENFPGAFQPQNMLPDYLKKIERNLNSPDPSRSRVSKFWINLTKKLNQALPDSYIHDIALLNCELRRTAINPHVREQMDVCFLELLENVSKRVFEMGLFQNWHENYKNCAVKSNIDLAESCKPLNIYENFLNRVPAECVTLPVIMESLLAQVEQDVGQVSSEGEAQNQQTEQEIINADEDESEMGENEYDEEEDSHLFESILGDDLHQPSVLSDKLSGGRRSTKSKDRSRSLKSKDSQPMRGKLSNKGEYLESDPMHKHKDRASKKKHHTKETEEKKSRKAVHSKTSKASTQKSWEPPPEMVKSNVYSENEFSGDSNVSQPIMEPFHAKRNNEGPYGYRPFQSNTMVQEPELDMCPPSSPPCFKAPIYIKTHDFASIRNCHLIQNFAQVIASNQIAGDYCSVKNFLWDGVPKFDKGLYMKLHANLTHFMHFLPPGVVDLKDMFFIIHLLMASGIELHLQKEARAAALRDVEENCTLGHYCCEGEAKKFRSLLDIYEKSTITDGEFDLSHNYLALGAELVNARMILAPRIDNKFDVLTPNAPDPEVDVDEQGNTLSIDEGKAPSIPAFSEANSLDFSVRHSIGLAEVSKEKDIDSGTEQNDTTNEFNLQSGGGDDIKFLIQPSDVEFAEPNNQSTTKIRDYQGRRDSVPIVQNTKHILKESRSGTVDQVHGAVIATGNIIQNSAELATSRNYGSRAGSLSYGGEEGTEPLVPPNSVVDDSIDAPTMKLSFGAPNSMNAADTQNYEAQCQERYFQNVKDLAVLQALITCPTLLAISESGALDISKWVETYLLCTGLPRASGESVIVGELKDWDHAEEMVPVQIIQVLCEASQSYLCMERIYCPFYDTILFIFNNPTPYSLTAQTSFINKLNTLAGLQHFLEYTLNDKEVMQFVQDTEKSKGISTLRHMSVTTLMRIIPEDQWVLIPSIKYFRKHKTEVDDEEDESGSKTPRKGKGTASTWKLGPRARTRKKKPIVLDDHVEETETLKASPSLQLDEQKEVPEQNDKRKKPSREKRGSKGSLDSKEGKNSKKGNGPASEEPKIGKKSMAASQVLATTQDTRKAGKLKEEVETPVSLLSPQAVRSTKKEKDKHPHHIQKETETPSNLNISDDPLSADTSLLKGQGKQFKVYDLGKRHLITTSDDYYLFPLDGTLISYNVSTIEPALRMMQLKVSKYGHETIFYPYYIPHEADMTADSFVLIPHFHTVLANGTIFAFQDKRALEESQYLKYSSPIPSSTSDAKKDSNEDEFSDIPVGNLFSEHDIIFIDDHYYNMVQSARTSQRNTKTSQLGMSKASSKQLSIQLNQVPDEESSDVKVNKESRKKPKKEKRNSVRSQSVRNLDKKKEKNKDKKKKGKEKSKEKKEPRKSDVEISYNSFVQISELNSERTDEFVGEQEEHQGRPDEVVKKISVVKKEKHVTGIERPPGEWKYPSSDETDTEVPPAPSVQFETFNWDQAEELMKPLVHIFKITLPSGLYVEVNDSMGPPLTREVKQTYISKGSAYSLVEKSRYYLMNGSVIRFLTNGVIQSLNARGITTNIRELSARVPNGVEKDNAWVKFRNSSETKVYDGDIILPTGEFWHVNRGKRTEQNALFLFTSGTMPNGEVFRRRQDGTIYIHRSDGCCIVHYPDGTRFTTRMIVQKDEVAGFEDWVFIGLKYMIEHPNYAPIIINTISGNIHIRLPQGEWTRILADGSIRIDYNEDYKINVDAHKATLSCSGYKHANPNIPNLTAVKLFHSKEKLCSPEPQTGQPVRQSKTSFQKKEEWSRHDVNREDAFSTSRSNVSKAQSLAGEATSGLMDPNLRPTPTASKTTKSATPSFHNIQDTELLNPVGANDDNDKSDFDIDSFTQFCDMWTLVKAIDTYDNRLAMDIFGNMIVDKNEKEEITCPSNEDILEALSSDKLMMTSKAILSGLITAPSSKEFHFDVKKHHFSRKFQPECCTQKPQTRIFAVKRDLSGYEFLKHSTVDKLMRKAKANPDALVLTDPMPSGSPRKFITIMEPIRDCENPNGAWKSFYREPVFRPRIICNKHLRVARPEDLRWFANIVATAHQKRGKFFLSPKDEYLRNKQRRQKEEEVAKGLEDERKIQEAKLEEECRLRDLAEGQARMEKQKLKQDKNNGTEIKKGKKNSSVNSKLSQQGKRKKSKSSSIEDKSEKSVDTDLRKKKKNSKSNLDDASSKSSKSSKGKSSFGIQPEDEEQIQQTETEEEGYLSLAGEAEDNPIILSSSVATRPQKITSDLGKYPENIPDIKGLYGPEPADLITVSPYQHVEVKSPKIALIVGTIVEIPRIDEKMKEILMAASKSYAKIVEEQNKVFESYKVDDPRTDQERELERQVKRELVEENIQHMHLLEQTAGHLLELVL